MTLHGARRVRAGRRGAGLRLGGAGDSATAAAGRALALRSGFTLAAWVRPARGAGRGPVVTGERPGATVVRARRAARPPERLAR